MLSRGPQSSLLHQIHALFDVNMTKSNLIKRLFFGKYLDRLGLFGERDQPAGRAGSFAAPTAQPALPAGNQPCHLSQPSSSRRRNVARPTISPVPWQFVRVANDSGITALVPFKLKINRPCATNSGAVVVP